MAKQETVLTPVFRGSYPYLFKPRTKDAQQKPLEKVSYEVQGIFDVTMTDKGFDTSRLSPEDKVLWTAMIDLAKRVKAAKWGNTTPPEYQSPIKSGDAMNAKLVAKGKEASEAYKGKTIINFKSKEFPVGIVKINPGGAPQPILDEKELYAGCYMQAEVTAFTYDYGKPGVSFGLNNVMKVRDGKPLAAQRDPVAAFASISANAKAEDYPDNSQMFEEGATDSLDI